MAPSRLPERSRGGAALRRPEWTARGLALDILRRVETTGAYPDRLLDRHLGRSGLASRDRALTTELVYGVLRWQRLLDWHLARLSTRPLDALVPWLRALLRVSAYQLRFLERIPAWATVHEAVELAKGRHPPRAAGYANAVLRALAEAPRPWPEPVADDRLTTLAIRVSQPTWLLRAWIERFGEEEALALALAMNERAPLVIRVNTLRAQPEIVRAALTSEGATVVPGRYAPESFIVGMAGDPGVLSPLGAGWCVVQDEASILVGCAVAPRPGETVADVCAAPGTKTTHLAQLMQNTGRIIAADPHAGRLRLLREACARLDVRIVEARLGPAEALADAIGPVCDRVLVDAPCSNLGVLRRNPDGKWRRVETDLEAHGRTQRRILAAAAKLVRPGGVLVYATCSLEPAENEEVVEGFRAHRPDFALDALPPTIPPACVAGHGMLRMFPHRHGSDGFTVLRLRRHP